MDSIINDNIKALEFYQSNLPHIKALRLPLEKYLGIKFFGYAKIYFGNKSYIYESNNDEFIEEYLKNVSHSYFIEGKCLHHSDKYHVALVSDKPNMNERGEMTYINNDIWHSISFTKTHETCVETWVFLGNTNNENIILDLIRNISVLEKFINLLRI